MKYVRVPTSIPIHEIRQNGAIFAPGRFVRLALPERHPGIDYVPLDALIVLRDSTIKVDQRTRYHYAEIGDIEVTTGGVTFKTIMGHELPTRTPSEARHGDVLISTVRTYRMGIGYVSSKLPNMVTTQAVMNLCGVTNDIPGLTLLYVYSFLRSEFFVEQVWSLLNRGVYPRMDTSALANILIPIPEDPQVIRYVSVLQQAVIDKEQALRARSETLDACIQEEIESHQQRIPFGFRYPTSDEIRHSGRLDAAIYAQEYQSKIWLVENYAGGYTTPDAAGFKVIPGPSLEIKLLGTRIDADEYQAGFYALILPTNISEYGTLRKWVYLGTPKHLPLLREGDIIFGESGFQKGRSVVLLDSPEYCTTNAHGLCARRDDGDTSQSIFFRCIFNWYRKMRLIDLMAVGGSGGHFSPNYFEYLKIPRFPTQKQDEIVQYYHHPTPLPSDPPLSLDNFVEVHRKWNESLGIWELGREMNVLKSELSKVQETIIWGKDMTYDLL